MAETFIEKRRRGIFGWIFLITFLGWNVLMIAWLVTYSQDVSAIAVGSSAEEAGRNIGATLGVGMILFVWALGSIITGILALLTRGAKVIIKKVE